MGDFSSSDVTIDDSTITVESGLYDTDDGIKLKVNGDSYPRIHLTPQGTIKSGDGTAAPTNYGDESYTTFVFNSSGTEAGNVFASWANLMTAVGSVDGPKKIWVPSNQTVPATGMPTAGWDLNGAQLCGPASLPSALKVLTFADGAKLDPSGLVGEFVEGLILYSQSTAAVVTLDAAGVAVLALGWSSHIVCDAEAFFDLNHASLYFVLSLNAAGLRTDSGLTASGADVAASDHPVVKAQTAALAYIIPDVNSVIDASTIEGAATVEIRPSNGVGLSDTWASAPGGTATYYPSGQEGTVLVKYKETTETVNNSDTLQSDDDLVLTLPADTTWELDVYLPMAAASETPDGQLQFTTSGTAGVISLEVVAPAAGATGANPAVVPIDKIVAASTPVAFGVTSESYVTVKGTIKSGEADNTLTLQWAQSTADASNTQVLGGAYMKATRIA